MIGAIFYLDSWLGYQEFYFEGENASDVLSQFECEQDLECLSRMGRVYGTPDDERVLDRIDMILEKKYSGELGIEDLRNLQIEISIGKFGVKEITDSDAEINKMKSNSK